MIGIVDQSATINNYRLNPQASNILHLSSASSAIDNLLIGLTQHFPDC
jgi:hypothetical protein